MLKILLKENVFSSLCLYFIWTFSLVKIDKMFLFVIFYFFAFNKKFLFFLIFRVSDRTVLVLEILGNLLFV